MQLILLQDKINFVTNILESVKMLSLTPKFRFHAKLYFLGVNRVSFARNCGD